MLKIVLILKEIKIMNTEYKKIKFHKIFFIPQIRKKLFKQSIFLIF